MSIKLNSLNAVYLKVVTAIGMHVAENGNLVHVTPDGVSQEVRVENLPVQLPTVENTRDHNPNQVIFHPLSENVLLGESPVIRELRAFMMDNLHSLILETVDTMIKIAQDTEAVANLTPTQAELLKAAAGADENTVKNWKSIMRRAESRGSVNRVITIFLKRGGEVNGKTYKRAAIVNFNLYNELTDGKLNIFGVKIRKADVALYTKVIESIIEDVAIIDKYSVGSDSLVAPYFDALIKAYAGIIKSINRVTWSLRKPIKELKGVDLHVKDDFSELLDDLLQYRDILPSLPYNDGTRTKETEKAKAPEVQPIPENQLPGVSNLSTSPQPYYAPQMQEQPLTVAQPVQAPPPPAQQQQHVSQSLPPIEHQLYGAPPAVQPYDWRNPYNGYAQPMPQAPYPFAPQPPQGYWQQPQPQTASSGYWWNTATYNGY